MVLMRFITWNCQGLGPALTKNALRDLKCRVDPHCVFLMETKNKEKKVECVRKSLGFNNGRLVEPKGQSGGLALWWSDLVDVDLFYESKNLFDASIICKASQKKFRVFFIYGIPSEKGRAEFWSFITRRASMVEGPLMCVGDFNELINDDEATGGGPRDRRRM